jgi:hypothetical protein
MQSKNFISNKMLMTYFYYFMHSINFVSLSSLKIYLKLVSFKVTVLIFLN